MQQFGLPPVLQSMHAVKSTGKRSSPPPLEIFNDSLSYNILADVKLIRYHLN
jgi:hypothetical protein